MKVMGIAPSSIISSRFEQNGGLEEFLMIIKTFSMLQ